ncbi:hypothetical protein P691DRAFT_609709, partial [Macrolepiota fuliginosa MF-IS2]
MSVRPFSPTESFAFPKPPTEKSSGDWSSQISRPPSSYTLNAGAGAAGAAVETSDPFADPTPPEPSTPSAVHPQFMEVETVKRPFIPTLGDELAVNIGDKVRILQMFDDGWALVEKNPPENGLIPIDCFRDHGVDVSAFIASKRVSS